MGGIRCFDPSAKVTHTRSQPLMSMFSMSGSSIRRCSPAMPNRASRTAWASACSSRGSSGTGGGWGRCRPVSDPGPLADDDTPHGIGLTTRGLPTLLREAVEVDEDPLTGKLPTMVSGQSGRPWAGQVLGYQCSQFGGQRSTHPRASCGVTSGPHFSGRLWPVVRIPFDLSQIRHWFRAGRPSPDTRS